MTISILSLNGEEWKDTDEITRFEWHRTEVVVYPNHITQAGYKIMHEDLCPSLRTKVQNEILEKTFNEPKRKEIADLKKTLDFYLK